MLQFYFELSSETYVLKTYCATSSIVSERMWEVETIEKKVSYSGQDTEN